MTTVSGNGLQTILTSLIADFLISGSPIIDTQDIEREKSLAVGNTFTVCAGRHKSEAIAINHFISTAPNSTVSAEIANEALWENLANASHEIRIMTNNVLRRCFSIPTLESIYFQTEDAGFVRPGSVVGLA